MTQISEIEKWLKEIQRDRRVIEGIIKEKHEMLKDLDKRVKILKNSVRTENNHGNK